MFKVDFIVVVKIDSEAREEMLFNTLVSLYRFTNPENINRLVVIDDNSSSEHISELHEKLLKDKSKKIILYRNQEQKGVGYSKNKGIELAMKYGKGDFIYLFDGDVLFLPNYLERLFEAFQNPENIDFELLGAGVHPYLQPRAGEDTSDLHSLDAVSGWSWMLSYETYEKYGKLADNAIGTGQSEDWEYCQRIRNDGKKVGVLKNQRVAHIGYINTEGKEIVGVNETRALNDRLLGGIKLEEFVK